VHVEHWLGLEGPNEKLYWFAEHADETYVVIAPPPLGETVEAEMKLPSPDIPTEYPNPTPPETKYNGAYTPYEGAE